MIILNQYRRVLVNISTFRCIVGFAMSFRVTFWAIELGFLGSFSIYAGVLGFLLLLLPLMWWKGKWMRKWGSGTVTKQRAPGKVYSWRELSQPVISPMVGIISYYQ